MTIIIHPIRSRKNAITVILALILSCFSVNAQEVSEKEAALLAGNFLFEKTALPFSLHLLERNGAYSVWGNSQTFVVVSGDRRVYPVLAYSIGTSWKESRQNPDFNWLIDSYQKEIEYVCHTSYKAPEDIGKIWSKYTAIPFVPEKSSLSVSPLVSATWSQDCYYNTAFPVDTAGPCGHPYTGCVATAMGEVMHYYQYPLQGVGSHSYNSYYGLLSADYGETTYDWDAMDNHLQSENEAVSQLLLHCAIGVDMVFLPGGQGSGAYDQDIPQALIQYFDYDTTARYIERDSYSGDWKALIRNEIEKRRPVIYGAVASQGNVGHTFVCDGFEDTTHFHINWGWGGYGNGYFLLDSLTLSNYHFDSYHDAIIGINPQSYGIENHVSAASPFFIAQSGNILHVKAPNRTIHAIQIVDMQGTMVCSETSSGEDSMDISCAGFPPQVYIVRIRIDNRWYVRRWLRI